VVRCACAQPQRRKSPQTASWPHRAAAGHGAPPACPWPASQAARGPAPARRRGGAARTRRPQRSRRRRIQSASTSRSRLTRSPAALTVTSRSPSRICAARTCRRAPVLVAPARVPRCRHKRGCGAALLAGYSGGRRRRPSRGRSLPLPSHARPDQRQAPFAEPRMAADPAARPRGRAPKQRALTGSLAAFTQRSHIRACCLDGSEATPAWLDRPAPPPQAPIPDAGRAAYDAMPRFHSVQAPTARLLAPRHQRARPCLRSPLHACAGSALVRDKERRK